MMYDVCPVERIVPGWMTGEVATWCVGDYNGESEVELFRSCIGVGLELCVFEVWGLGLNMLRGS